MTYQVRGIFVAKDGMSLFPTLDAMHNTRSTTLTHKVHQADCYRFPLLERPAQETDDGSPAVETYV